MADAQLFWERKIFPQGIYMCLMCLGQNGRGAFFLLTSSTLCSAILTATIIYAIISVISEKSLRGCISFDRRIRDSILQAGKRYLNIAKTLSAKTLSEKVKTAFAGFAFSPVAI